MGAEKRRSPRFEIELPVTLQIKKEHFQLKTLDVSRHGVFLQTDTPRPLRELISLKIDLPESFGQLEVLGSVIRSRLPDQSKNDDPAGMAVQFFALGGSAKDLWNKFFLSLEKSPELPATPTQQNFKPSSASSALPSLPNEPADISLYQQAFSENMNPVVTYVVRLTEKEQVDVFYNHDITVGEMFLETPDAPEIADVVQLNIVGPNSDDEYVLFGEVIRITAPTEVRGQGIVIEFIRLDHQEKQRLLQFLQRE